MKKTIKLTVIAFFCIGLYSCKTTSYNYSVIQTDWEEIAVINDVEIYIDTSSIKKDAQLAYAFEKRIFTSDESRKLYVDKIKDAYTKLGKTEKANKWNDFSYCIYYSEYECLNKRFRIMSIEDFDSNGKRIAITKPKGGKSEWLNVSTETQGDYSLFFICDF